MIEMILNHLKVYFLFFAIFCVFSGNANGGGDVFVFIDSRGSDAVNRSGLWLRKFFGNKIFNKQMIYYENLFYNINSQRIIWPINVFRS